MSRPRILLVDDNAELVNLLARLVEAEGWEPVTALQGAAGLEQIAGPAALGGGGGRAPPRHDGLRAWAAALQKAGVPYVFMTGVLKGGRAATEARQQHGAAGYFEKPFAGTRS